MYTRSTRPEYVGKCQPDPLWCFLHTGELRKQGLRIKLRDQPFQILLRYFQGFNPGLSELS
jgi:hypothetical protein